MLDNPPKQVTWQGKAVTDVVNQGQCGSSWAFSSIVALEGLNAIQHAKIEILSTQQLLDCSNDYGNYGCNGGYMEASFWYVIDKGIALDSAYPYAAQAQKCKYTQKMRHFSLKECAPVTANSSKTLKSALAKQPVASAVAADSTGFQFYNKGVFKGKCTTMANHGIAITGYGNLDGDDYWELKNSWGADWGMKGYILLKRDNEEGPGLCGILTQNSVPLH